MLDVNVGLVLGDEACLIIDTLITHAQGAELITALRRITPLPWVVVNTHGHYDHYFGNRMFLPSDIWGHDRADSMIKDHGEVKRAHVQASSARSGDITTAEQLDEVEITPPNRTFSVDAAMDLGGRMVHLRHLGRGHTDNDIVVEVPDAKVLFAGDLVEEGAPPSFGDSFPLDWAATMDRVMALAAGPVVPGHGDVVDRDFVAAQGAELTVIARRARDAFEAGRPVEQALTELPLPEEYARPAIRRAYRQLRGDPPYETADELTRRLSAP
jgi:glyoxylase-like metal-dependent hydrolase (beta-lactamase superfamily II)